jgi:hypothetical protein
MNKAEPAASTARIASDAELVRPALPPLTLVRETFEPRRSIPWTPFIASVAVIGASLVAASPLTDAVSGTTAIGARLRLPLSYIFLAPVCDTLDGISLFSQGQHLWLVATYILLYACWRISRARRSARRRPSFHREIVGAGKAVLALVAVYAAGALLPRPIAKLAMSPADAIVIDFHSHTRYSWDGRSSFSPEQSRRWHRASGFDVAYVTDHSTFAGAEQAALGNPARAGAGTVLLSGIEVRDRGSHLAVLGTDARDWRSYTAGNLHERTFRREMAARGGARPIVLFTLPGNLREVSAMAVDAIELSDAAPRALSQADRERGSMTALAGRQNRAVVASSNNHGWASASPAWSVMVIPGWRTMTPARLDTAIRRTILARGFAAVRVIDRREPAPVSAMGLSMTVPNAARRMLVTMSWPERVSWLTWIWLSYIVFFAADRWRGFSRRRF